MRIVFMGTPQFALPSLDVLIKGEEIVGVVTQPDRPKGRGRKVEPSPIKREAEKYKLPLYQPTDLKHPHFRDWLKERNPELIIVVAYGQILPSHILCFPPRGCLNAHASLLPQYRGAAPIQWALIKGEKRTGVSIMLMNEGLDKGNIVLQKPLDIGPYDTAGILSERLASLSARLILKSLKMIKDGKIKSSLQPAQKVTYASRLKKSDGLIDWQSSARDIHNLVRGLNPRPGAYTYIRRENKGQKKILKIWKTELITNYQLPITKKRRPGEILEIAKDKGIIVSTGREILLIKEVQGEGGRKMSGGQYVKGCSLREGCILGEKHSLPYSTDTMSNLIAVIMAGGKGERFWPKSRAQHPKQLLPIAGVRTMLQETAERIKPLVTEKNIYIVTGKVLAKEVKSQLPSLPKKNIISEPMGRNTAACIGLAAIKIQKEHPQSTMVVLAADHLIREREKFLEIIRVGAGTAEETGNLITLGIKPTRPETGYGYIEVRSQKSENRTQNTEHRTQKIENRNEKIEACKVEKFIEKPDKETAKKFLAGGNYYWNSGMFIWTVESILKAIKEYMPALFKGLKVIKDSLGTVREREVTRQIFQGLDSVSIDYGVMEKAKNVSLIKVDLPWDDVGSWLAMERIHSKDDKGNVVLGKFEGIDTRNCVIVSDEHLVTTLGVSDLIVVTTPQATLICSKDRAQDVKKIVKKLAENKLEEYL